MEDKKQSKATRERLIEAAGELFAEKGFKETTVREICDKAKANLAAVNYYFRDKERLYQEVLYIVVSKMGDKSFLDIMDGPSTSSRDKIYLFVWKFLARRFDPQAPAWHFELIARQMVESPESLKSIVSDNIRTHHQVLYNIVSEFLGPGASPDTVHKCILSIFGQNLIYVMMHHPHSPIPDDFKVEMTPAEIEERANHIADFSIAGLTWFRDSLKGPEVESEDNP